MPALCMQRPWRTQNSCQTCGERPVPVCVCVCVCVFCVCVLCVCFYMYVCVCVYILKFKRGWALRACDMRNGRFTYLCVCRCAKAATAPPALLSRTSTTATVQCTRDATTRQNWPGHASGGRRGRCHLFLFGCVCVCVFLFVCVCGGEGVSSCSSSDIDRPGHASGGRRGRCRLVLFVCVCVCVLVDYSSLRYIHNHIYTYTQTPTHPHTHRHLPNCFLPSLSP
jgi:hypothetical protein